MMEEGRRRGGGEKIMREQKNTDNIMMVLLGII